MPAAVLLGLDSVFDFDRASIFTSLDLLFVKREIFSLLVFEGQDVLNEIGFVSQFRSFFVTGGTQVNGDEARGPSPEQLERAHARCYNLARPHPDPLPQEREHQRKAPGCRLAVQPSPSMVIVKSTFGDFTTPTVKLIVNDYRYFLVGNLAVKLFDRNDLQRLFSLDFR
jgi:hypothetical protein